METYVITKVVAYSFPFLSNTHYSPLDFRFVSTIPPIITKVLGGVGYGSYETKVLEVEP